MSKHLNYRSGNPALSSAIFSAEAYKADANRQVMTLNGAVDKTILCLALLLAFGIAGFKFHQSMQGFLIPELSLDSLLPWSPSSRKNTLR